MKNIKKTVVSGLAVIAMTTMSTAPAMASVQSNGDLDSFDTSNAAMEGGADISFVPWVDKNENGTKDLDEEIHHDSDINWNSFVTSVTVYYEDENGEVKTEVAVPDTPLVKNLESFSAYHIPYRLDVTMTASPSEGYKNGDWNKVSSNRYVDEVIHNGGDSWTFMLSKNEPSVLSLLFFPIEIDEDSDVHSNKIIFDPVATLISVGEYKASTVVEVVAPEDTEKCKSLKISDRFDRFGEKLYPSSEEGADCGDREKVKGSDVVDVEDEGDSETPNKVVKTSDDTSSRETPVVIVVKEDTPKEIVPTAPQTVNRVVHKNVTMAPYSGGYVPDTANARASVVQKSSTVKASVPEHTVASKAKAPVSSNASAKKSASSTKVSAPEVNKYSSSRFSKQSSDKEKSGSIKISVNQDTPNTITVPEPNSSSSSSEVVAQDAIPTDNSDVVNYNSEDNTLDAETSSNSVEDHSLGLLLMIGVIVLTVGSMIKRATIA